MSDTSSLSIRQEVSEYLQASEAVLADAKGASQAFTSASDTLLRKNRNLNDKEMGLVQDMVLRLSAKLIPSSQNKGG